jgi:hypothetical protein
MDRFGQIQVFSFTKLLRIVGGCWKQKTQTKWWKNIYFGCTKTWGLSFRYLYLIISSAVCWKLLLKKHTNACINFINFAGINFLDGLIPTRARDCCIIVFAARATLIKRWFWKLKYKIRGDSKRKIQQQAHHLKNRNKRNTFCERWSYATCN